MPVRAAIDEARQVSARAASADVVSPEGMRDPAYPCAILVEGDVPLDCGWHDSAEQTSEVLLATNHVIRSFHSDDGQWDDSPRTNCTKAFYTTSPPDVSRIALALTSFHCRKLNVGIASASVTTPHSAGYSVTLSSLSNGWRSVLESTSCSGLQLDPSDTDLQCGTWSLPESHQWNNPQLSTTCGITFPVAYDHPPKVLVWVKNFFLGDTGDHSLRVLVSNITTVGFTLETTSLVEMSLYGAETTWLSCSADRPDVHFGTVQAQNGVLLADRTTSKGNVAFQTGLFMTTPQVVVGITGFHTNKECDLHIAVEAVEVTSQGMKWRVDGKGDTDITSVECSFVVLV